MLSEEGGSKYDAVSNMNMKVSGASLKNILARIRQQN
jgi:hypothetical protein